MQCIHVIRFVIQWRMESGPIVCITFGKYLNKVFTRHFGKHSDGFESKTIQCESCGSKNHKADCFQINQSK